jgi:UDP-3-O-[3-hydroxymyristoyl] glucosamine N-acyltransferase
MPEATIVKREISPYKGVAKQAAKMAATIREKGWVQGAYVVYDGRVCLAGSALVGRNVHISMSFATQDTLRVLRAVGAAACLAVSALVEHHCSYLCATGFNDVKTTTKEDILAILDLIAETA